MTAIGATEIMYLHDYPNMDYYHLCHMFPLHGHFQFKTKYDEISARISSWKSSIEIPGYDKIVHTTLREHLIVSAYQGLIAQGAHTGIPILSVGPNPGIIQNKSNQFDSRRALVLEDCDLLSLALMDLIIANNSVQFCASDSLQIFRFVHFLQCARSHYFSLPNNNHDDFS
jgi:hypothetical protein